MDKSRAEGAGNVDVDRRERGGQRQWEREKQRLLASGRQAPKLNPGATPFLPLSQRAMPPTAAGQSGFLGTSRRWSPGNTASEHRSQGQSSKPSNLAPATAQEGLEASPGHGKSVGLSDDDSDADSSLCDSPQRSSPRSEPKMLPLPACGVAH